MNKLVRASKEQRMTDPRNIIGEKSILESLNGPTVGLTRLVGRVENFQGNDENGNLIEVVLVASPDKLVEYVVDAGGGLKFDDEEGIATFSSRGRQYKIRAIQDSDRII
jgi:hypothetical protein